MKTLQIEEEEITELQIKKSWPRLFWNLTLLKKQFKREMGGGHDTTHVEDELTSCTTS